jgi:hypothetical protein
MEQTMERLLAKVRDFYEEMMAEIRTAKWPCNKRWTQLKK